MKITRVSGVVYRQDLKPGAPLSKFAGSGTIEKTARRLTQQSGSQ